LTITNYKETPMTKAENHEIVDNNDPQIIDLLSRITLKSFKHYEDFSQETNAFAAVLHIDGTLCGAAENDGHGGMTSVYLKNTEGEKAASKLEEESKKLVAYSGRRPNGTEFVGYWDLEMLIDTKVEQMAQAKWVQAKTRKAVLVDTREGETYSYKRRAKVSDKARTAVDESAIINAAKSQNPTWTKIYGLRSIEGGEIVNR
tara:strand:- start:1851 stop:2456 length:606 start_codon:yes stop_codon:yes gene_type:complete